MDIPKELRYSRDHEWAKVEGGNAKVGITRFAVEQLGDITLVELPEVGNVVNAGDAIGVIESVKAVSDLYAPVSGTVKNINEELEESPEKVNEDPYGDGWMLEIELGDSSEVEDLLDAGGYKAHLDSLDD
jgi:glycine cleavage system H protein